MMLMVYCYDWVDWLVFLFVMGVILDVMMVVDGLIVLEVVYDV